MCIITISREFGSGGRERIAALLQFAYYDKESAPYKTDYAKFWLGNDKL